MLPVIYVRMSKSQDHEANIQGLLFGLIIPTTLILIIAKTFGTVANDWEASLHADGLAEGFLAYRLGKVIISFSRTGIGFVLASLICASTAIAYSGVNTKYRLLAGACLISNIFLLLATGSFGSIIAVLCGLAAIFYTQLRKVRITKVITSITVVCCIVLLVYGLSPSSTKKYLGKRYEHRVVEMDTDRLTLWSRAIDYLVEHPQGVGLTFTVGEVVQSHPHNDYIAYLVSYGVIGGLAYPFLLIGLFIYFSNRRRRRIENNNAFAIHLAGFGVVVAFMINSMTDNIAVNRWYFNMIWSLIWYCYFCSRAAQSVIVPDEVTEKTAVAETTIPQLK
ncbi:MAG: O-antigen ligase family protein [Smithella sp.]